MILANANRRIGAVREDSQIQIPPMIGNNNNPRLSSAAQSNTLTNSIAKIRMA